MSWFTRVFGIDLIEMAIWVVATILVGVLAVNFFNDHNFGFATALASLVAYAVRRHRIIRRRGAEGETSGAWRMADLEGRIAELETLHQRVAELEERVEFNERLLAQQHDAPRLEVPKR